MESTSTLRIPEYLDWEILRRKELTLTAKRVYSVIRYCQGDDQSCCLAIPWLAKRLDMSRQAVSRAVKLLIENKLLSMIKEPRKSPILSLRLLSPKKKFLLLEYRRNSGHSESTMLIYHYLKSRQGKNDRAWPHIKTIGLDLGLSKSTVLRSLADLEKGSYILVDHAHGGLKQGNKYSLSMKPFFVTERNPKAESGVSSCNRNNNTSFEVKNNNPDFSRFTELSKRRRLLHDYGVAWPVAESLAKSHSWTEIENAVLNAVGQGRLKAQQGKRFKRGAYIVATLNGARRENRPVQLNLFMQTARADHRAAQGGKAGLLSTMNAENFKAKKAAMIAQLRATA